ncbi:transposase [Methylococcus sp. Mc7]|nr:transposase [Methylococcus sp. Mc7]
MKQSPHSRDLRRGRFSESGRPYLVTTVTHQRTPRFLAFGACRCVVQELRNADARGDSRTLAWVLMPDHLHWLFELQAVSLSTVVGRFKQASARNVKGLLECKGQRLWQPGFHDRAVRKEEDIRAIARYVVANPLRAGLVKRLGDYPHWDAVWL